MWHCVRVRECVREQLVSTGQGQRQRAGAARQRWLPVLALWAGAPERRSAGARMQMGGEDGKASRVRGTARARGRRGEQEHAQDQPTQIEWQLAHRERGERERAAADHCALLTGPRACCC